MRVTVFNGIRIDCFNSARAVAEWSAWCRSVESVQLVYGCAGVLRRVVGPA